MGYRKKRDISDAEIVTDTEDTFNQNDNDILEKLSKSNDGYSEEPEPTEPETTEPEQHNYQEITNDQQQHEPEPENTISDSDLQVMAEVIVFIMDFVFPMILVKAKLTKKETSELKLTDNEKYLLTEPLKKVLLKHHAVMSPEAMLLLTVIGIYSSKL